MDFVNAFNHAGSYMRRKWIQRGIISQRCIVATLPDRTGNMTGGDDYDKIVIPVSDVELLGARHV
jgi:hypothetical protein